VRYPKKIERKEGDMKCVTGIRAQDLGRLTAAAAGRRRGAQDLALIHLARDVMLRPQEIPALTWDRMVFLDDGTAYLTLPGPGGRCVKRPVSGYTVRLLAALLPDDGIPEGGQIFSLTCSQINRRVGSLCEAAGMPGEYAASSPRVGKAIDLADSGMSVEDLRAYGRWRSLDSAWAYVQRSPSYAKVRRLRSMTTGKE
jgi:hypothetical protein